MIRLHRLLYFLAALAVCAICASDSFAAQNQALHSRDRVTAVVDDSNTAPLAGTVHSKTRTHSDLGPLPSDARLDRVTIIFKLSAQQQQDLDALLVQQQQPSSPNFHKWLTTAQYQDRFGISPADLAKVKAWLQSQGFDVNDASSDRTQIAFSGSAAQINAAFRTEIHQYQGNGEAHFANASEISIPAALAGVVLGIRGLNDFRPHPRPSARKLKSSFTSSLSGNHFLAPGDFATIYNLKPLYSAGFTGAGQKIAIVGQTDIKLADIQTFRSVSGLPASDPTVILVPGSADPGTLSGDIDEANLDIEWSGAVAPGATIIYVNSKNGAFDSLQYAVQQNLAPVISVSYGDCEPNLTSEISAMQTLFQQANAQGQTIVSAAGDDGAADCDYSNDPKVQITSAQKGLQVDFPPSSPNVTGVGGSTFVDPGGNFWSQGNDSGNASALSYIPETAWNDTTTEIANGGSLTAGGGGASKATNGFHGFPKPPWQVGAGVPADGARDVPDVTFAASSDHDGYLICSQSSCTNGYRDASDNLTVVGGTSAGSPTFAGVIALINQKMNSTQGNLNPALYTLAGTSTDAFHDITTGDNKVPCKASSTDCPAGGGSIGYSAGPGYDQVTGLGSVNAANLVYELAGAVPPSPVSDFQLGIFQANAANGNITFTRGATAPSDTITVSALNGFSGTVALSCTVASSLTNTTCKVSPATLNGSGTATLTVAASPLAVLQDLPNQKTPGSPLWASALFGLSALVFVGKKQRLATASNKAMLSVLLVAAIAAFGVGCGGGGSSTPAVTTTPTVTTPAPATTGVTGSVTVQATSGSLSHSVQVNVKVN